MRGLAALALLMGQAIYIVEQSNNAAFTTRAILFQANSAVVFFYVLSGFVLGSSPRKLGGQPMSFVRYALTRLF